MCKDPNLWQALRQSQVPSSLGEGRHDGEQSSETVGAQGACCMHVECLGAQSCMENRVLTQKSGLFQLHQSVPLSPSSQWSLSCQASWGRLQGLVKVQTLGPHYRFNPWWHHLPPVPLGKSLISLSLRFLVCEMRLRDITSKVAVRLRGSGM